MKVLMLAVVMTLAAGQAQAVNEDGSIDGLKAKFVDVNGIRTRYYEMGSGEPMVMIHAEEGFSGHASANYFAKNIPGLAKHFHVFALDRLGSGLTDNPKTDKDYNIHAEMDHIVQFIQTLKLGKVNLVGHSHGGGMALFIAVEHPDIVRTLTIMDSVTAAPLGPGVPPSENPVLKCPKEPEMAFWKCRLQALSYKPEANWDQEFWDAASLYERVFQNRKRPRRRSRPAPASGLEQLPWIRRSISIREICSRASRINRMSSRFRC